MLRSTCTAALLLLLAPACAEDSSFVLRWQVGRDADDAEKQLRSVRQCSELGISKVRVITTTLDGVEQDRREFPCFYPAFAEDGGAAPGPDLAAGTYKVTVVGLTRRGLARPDPSDPDNSDLVLARDNRSVTVDRAGEGALVDEFRLVGIDECHDGTDNDRDGAVDMADAPCRSGQAFESDDLSGALFTFDATLLPDELFPAGNPAADCASLGLSRIRIVLDGDPAQAREFPCTTLTQSFSADLAPGEHTWKATGLGADGQPRTRALPEGGQSFTVAETGFVLEPIAVDFTIDTFLGDPPFAEPLRIGLGFVSDPDAPGKRSCAPRLGALTLGQVEVALLDETGAAATDVVIPALMDAPFPVQGECLDFEGILVTSPIEWSAEPGHRGYRVQVRAWAADDPDGAPCFASEPVPLAPGVSPGFNVPRVRTDGACSDCPQGNECDRCEAGVCKQ